MFSLFFSLLVEILAKSKSLVNDGEILYMFGQKIFFLLFGYCYLLLFLHGSFFGNTLPNRHTILFYAVM